MESGFFAGFLEWLLALVHHWELIVVTGAIPFAIDLLDRVFEWKMPKRMYIVFLAAGLFLAMFAAWRDEHESQPTRNVNPRTHKTGFRSCFAGIGIWL